MSTKDKDKIIDETMADIEKRFGKGAIMRMGAGSALPNIEVVPTGSISLDIALGVGGFPKGRIVEVYGPEGSGKTTLALHAVAEVQKHGGVAAFIDAEHALDIFYAIKIGVNSEGLLMSQPDTGEQALEIVEALIRSCAVGIIVVDSVAALTPKAEIEGKMGDPQMGSQARLMSQAMRKLAGALSKSRAILLFINQTRMKIGVMFGNPETTTGGNALKFYSSVRIDIRRVAGLKVGDQVVGARTRVKVVKNKVAPPFKQSEFDIIYGQGISREGEVLDLASEMHVVEKSGAWYSYKGERIGQGRDNTRNFLAEHPETMAEIEAKILEHYGIKYPETKTAPKEEQEESNKKSKKSK